MEPPFVNASFFYGIHNRFYNLLDPQLGSGWLGWGMMMYFSCWPETMFWRQRKMNFKNIFILPNVIGDRSRRRFGGIFIKIPKVTTARSSLISNKIGFQMV